MNELIEALKTVQATNFTLYLKAHNYHWNVEGSDFPMYHSFFGSFYEEVFGAVDTIAELIRTLDEFAPGSLVEFSKRSNITDELGHPGIQQMVGNLFAGNQTLLTDLIAAYKLAEKFSEFGILNALQDRIEAHKKHAWMLRSMLKGDTE